MGGVVEGEAAITFRALVAGNVLRLRESAGVAVERIVQAARGMGLNWSNTWVRGVEQGHRVLTAEELVALPMVLTSALAHRVTLADLLLGDDQVELGKGEPVAAAYLRETVTSAPFKRHVSEAAADATALLLASNAAAVEKMRTVREANLGDVDMRTLGLAEAGSGSAEARLARRLEVPEIVVIAAAASLWGRSLSDERDAQMRTNGAPQSIATVTRRLTEKVIKRIIDATDATVPEPTGTGTGVADATGKAAPVKPPSGKAPSANAASGEVPPTKSPQAPVPSPRPRHRAH